MFCGHILIRVLCLNTLVTNWSDNHLIFIMGIYIPGKMGFILGQGQDVIMVTTLSSLGVLNFTIFNTFCYEKQETVWSAASYLHEILSCTIFNITWFTLVNSRYVTYKAAVVFIQPCNVFCIPLNGFQFTKCTPTRDWWSAILYFPVKDFKNISLSVA